MNHSETLNELAAALAKAQGVITGAKKDSNNPFFKSKYADLASVVEAIRVPFKENGLSYIQSIEPSDKNEVRVETTILHASGQWFSCGVLAVPVAKGDAQGFGSALTYARRYSLSAAAGIAPEDDDGNAASKAMPKPAKNNPEPPPPEVNGDGDVVVVWTAEQKASIFSLCDTMYDLLLVIGMPETEAQLKCDYYLQMEHKIPAETVTNRMATAIQAIEAKAKKKLAEA